MGDDASLLHRTVRYHYSFRLYTLLGPSEMQIELGQVSGICRCCVGGACLGTIPTARHLCL